MSEIVERVADLMAPVGSGIVVPTEALPSNLQKSYWYLLSLCDGGTVNCFFHFFGRMGPSEHNLLDWNRPPLWKHHYNLGEQSFVFAEDIWGTQFYFDIRGNRRVVKMLIPDGGRTTVCANTFEEFLENEVLSTGFNKRPRFLAERFFHERHVAFRPFTHISCKVPGMLGGSDEDLAARGQTQVLPHTDSFWSRKPRSPAGSTLTMFVWRFVHVATEPGCDGAAAASCFGSVGVPSGAPAGHSTVHAGSLANAHRVSPSATPTGRPN